MTQEGSFEDLTDDSPLFYRGIQFTLASLPDKKTVYTDEDVQTFARYMTDYMQTPEGLSLCQQILILTPPPTTAQQALTIPVVVDASLFQGQNDQTRGFYRGGYLVLKEMIGIPLGVLHHEGIHRVQGQKYAGIFDYENYANLFDYFRCQLYVEAQAHLKESSFQKNLPADWPVPVPKSDLSFAGIWTMHHNMYPSLSPLDIQKRTNDTYLRWFMIPGEWAQIYQGNFLNDIKKMMPSEDYPFGKVLFFLGDKGTEFLNSMRAELTQIGVMPDTLAELDRKAAELTMQALPLQQGILTDLEGVYTAIIDSMIMPPSVAPKNNPMLKKMLIMLKKIKKTKRIHQETMKHLLQEYGVPPVRVAKSKDNFENNSNGKTLK